MITRASRPPHPWTRRLWIGGRAGETEPDVVVAIGRRVPVAVGGTHPRGLVVPGAAAQRPGAAYRSAPRV